MSPRSIGLGVAVLLCWLALPAGVLAQSICVIQGSGAENTVPGARVTTTGVVTADFTATSLEGFFLQEPACDSDPDTSDAIWVSTPGRRPELHVGHRISITGRVSEVFGLTTLEFQSLSDEGAFPGGIEVVTLSGPADPVEAAAYLEAHEGMLVALPPSRVVGATNRFGEAYLMPETSGVTRLFRGDEDGRKLGLAAPDGWLALDHGDRVVGGAGALGYSFGEYKMLAPATRLPQVEPSGVAPPQLSSPEAGVVTIATYNLESLFDTTDDPGTNDTVVSIEEYQASLARRADSIGRLLGSPEILAVQEVEKLSVLEDLAAEPELGAAGYEAVLIEGADPRGIDVGLLVSSERVRVLEAEARPTCTDLVPAAGDPLPCDVEGASGAHLLFARPPLVVQLELEPGGGRLAVIVNHFNAQSDGPADDTLRLGMAEHVAGLVAELKAVAPDVPLVVLGDLNDFEDSATLARLTRDGSLVDPLTGNGRERPYTTLHRGVSQTLDYVLLDTSLASQLVESRILHVNVDFAQVAPESAPDATHRASDHDPVLVRLR